MDSIIWILLILASFGVGGGFTWAFLKVTSALTGAGAKGIEKGIDLVTPNTNENIKILQESLNEVRVRNGMKKTFFAVEVAKKELQNKEEALLKAQGKVDKIEQKHLSK